MRSLRGVSLAIVLVLAVTGATACDLLRESAGPTLEVTSPPDFARVQLGESLDVVSRTTDSQGVSRVELYVGEDLYRTDASPSAEGEKAWTCTQTWWPTAAGLYTLTVVAYNGDGVGSTPWAVAVEVVEGPSIGGTPVSTVPLSTGTAPPVTTGTAPPPSSTPTVALLPTGTAPPPLPTATAPPPPPPTDTPQPPPTNTPPPMADPYIVELSISPEQPHVYEYAELRVVVRNGGNAPSARFGVGAGANDELTLIGYGELNPGQEHVFTIDLVFDEPGPATVTAQVGFDPRQDRDEDNNIAELVVNVQPGDGGPQPDLYIGRVTLDPSSPRVGEEMEIEVEIDNAGPGYAGPHVVIWKSDPDTISCSWDIEGLNAERGITVTCRHTFTEPNAGQFTYTIVDANGDVDESNEDNNHDFKRINVRAAS